MNITTAKRREIAKILKRHRGSKVELARRAGIKLATTISDWLAGRTISANIADHAAALANELASKEQVIQLSAPSARAVIEEIRSGK